MTIDEIKIPNVSCLHSDTNIREIEKKVTDQNYDKYITTAELPSLQDKFLIQD